MIECPRCKKKTPDIIYVGPVLFVEGTASIKPDGKVEALGPARATLTIEVGTELNSDHIHYKCPLCKYQGPKSEFPVVRVCALTGQTATVEFKTPFGTIWIADGQQERAADIFSERNGQWEVELTEEMLHV